MREIKFRAWDKWNKKFVYFNVSNPLIADIECLSIFKNIEIQQYVGLKDKNGVEIYCGDILETTYYGTKKIQDTIMECAIMGLYSIDTSKVEVIGNIYENPELLESK